MTSKTSNSSIRYVFSFVFFVFVSSIDYIIYDKEKNIIFTYTLLFEVFELFEQNVLFTITFLIGIFGILGRTSFLEIHPDFEKNVENYYIDLAKKIYNVDLQKMNSFWWSMLLGREFIQQKMTLPSTVGLCNFCRHKPKKAKIDDKYGLCPECLRKFKPPEQQKKLLSEYTHEEKEELIREILAIELTDQEKQKLALKAGVWIKEKEEDEKEENN